MEINILEILLDNGYNVVKQVDMKEFTVKLMPEIKSHMLEQAEKQGTIYTFDIDGHFVVVIGEVGFNELGNLYIDLIDANTGELWEAIEY